MTHKSKMRGITHSVMGNGTARIVFSGRSSFKGLLVTEDDETISIQGHSIDPANDEVFSTDPSVPSTSHMQISVVDNETGIKIKIASIPVDFIPIKNSKTDIVYLHTKIEHPCISFKTQEILIGNRADMEIQAFLDPTIVNSHISHTLSHPTKNFSSGKRVHVGRMNLKVVASQKFEASPRKESICLDCSTEIIEQSEDFLA